MTTTTVSSEVVSSPAGLEIAKTSAAPGRLRQLTAPRWLRMLSGPLLLIAAWAASSHLGLLNRDLFPPPGQVAEAAFELAQSGELARHVGRSVLRVLQGTALGIVIGGGVAIAAGLTRLGEDLVDSTMQVVKAVPNFALTPLLIIWMGIGEGPKVVLITLGVAVAIYINTYSGIRTVDRHLVEVAQSLGASRWVFIREVVLPGALPGFLVGLRLGFSSAWLSLIFAETINTTEGIGFLMARAQMLLQFDISVLILILYAAVGMLSYALVRLLERHLLVWRNNFQGV